MDHPCETCIEPFIYGGKPAVNLYHWEIFIFAINSIRVDLNTHKKGVDRMDSGQQEESPLGQRILSTLQEYLVYKGRFSPLVDRANTYFGIWLIVGLRDEFRL